VPLIRACRGGYRYKLKKNGEYEDTSREERAQPHRRRHQYACLHAEASNGAGFNDIVRREVKKARSGGWT
jgi:hypothetical protein